jgi:hypothetical protein
MGCSSLHINIVQNQKIGAIMITVSFIKNLAAQIAGVTKTEREPIEKALIEGLKEPSAALVHSIVLNDRAEIILDKVVQCHSRGRDSLMYTSIIDGAWAALSDARKKAGRELPGC